ncbi:MAG: DegT/DnrJ/EryC1/StrS family aminotransferase [Syntrophales bacterium]
MFIPFIDLKAQYESIRDEITSALQQVLDHAGFIGGTFVSTFEREFAAFCGRRYAAGVSSGTSALWAALHGLGVGPGDEVITVPNTFIATAEAISRCGAKPVFVDIREDTYTMNPSLLESAITKKTKAIIPVHLFGQTADMQPIMDIARRRGLYVIEDASQAHGSEYMGRPAGSIGDAGCFSFYPGKNLGSYGDAGAVLTDREDLDRNIRLLRDHGQPKKYRHEIIGWNDRMDGLQGAVLRVKLKHLQSWNEKRRRNAVIYHELLSPMEEIILPEEAGYGKHVYHIYAIRVRDRDGLIAALLKDNIHCGIHYPVPIHLQKAYRHLGLKRGSFPVAERCCRELLSLPMFPELKASQIEYVADAIREYLRSGMRIGTAT